MKKSRPIFALALAACSFDLPAVGDDNLIWLQVTPAGHFKPSDGRDLPVPAWYIDAAVAAQVIERWRSRRNALVVDYEHQTLHKEQNGKQAPAAGWIRDLEWREGQGLFALVELTARARQYIADREYLYFSPVFLYDRTTGHVLAVQMGALTNTPGIDGMQELNLLRAAATSGFTLEEEADVNPLLLAVIATLGLAETTTEEQAIAALTAHQTHTANLRKALGVDENADGDALVAACTGLQAKAAAVTDPAQFVPVSVVEQLKGEVAALTARLEAVDVKETDALITQALEDGRLLKPMEDWARKLAKTDRAALTAYLEAAQPIAALTATQTQGKPPVADEKTGLTADEQAVCTAMGLTPEQFKAAKEA